MKQRQCLFRAATGLLAVGLAVSAAGQELKEVPQEDVAKLEAIIGPQLSAKPAKPRRVLVFWRCEGFVHGKAIEYGNKAFQIAADKTKAFSVDFSNDYAALRPENLAKYDAVVLNNTTGLKTHKQGGLEEPGNTFLEPALLNFARSGKGVVAIHAGADNFNLAHQASEMVGGRFDGHPWGSGGTWAFKLDEPGHPVNAPFGGKNFKFSDEIYQQSSPAYNRAKLRVLVSLDLSDEETAKQNGQKRADKDFAVSWVRPYGKGRVFYTSFGHDQRAFMDMNILAHIFNGLQYALGDLKADDTPPGFSDADLERVKTATVENNNEVWAFLQDIMAHSNSDKADAANRAKLEALLADASVPPYGKKALLRIFISFGAPKNLKPVFDGLKDEITRDWAATVLAGAAAKDVDPAVMQMMPGVDAKQRITLIQVLAAHKNADAIKLLLNDKDASVLLAAIAALGRIGDENSLKILNGVKFDGTQETARLNAVSACLGAISATRGNNRTVVDTARRIMGDANAYPPLRAAAAKALLFSVGDYFEEGMKDKELLVRQALIQASDDVPADALVNVMKKGAPEDQISIAAKLAARGDKKNAPLVAALFNSGNPDVVCAALTALIKIGTADQVPLIYAQMEKKDAIERTAIETLNDMRAAGVAEQLLAIAQKDPDQTGRVIGILGERMEAATVPVFETFVKSDNADIRRDAWKALGKITGDKSFAQLAAWLPLVKDEERNNAEATLRIAGRNADPASRTKAIVDAWAKAQVPSKRVLAPLMASFQDPSFVPLLKGALADDNRDLREAALRALADWTDMSPFPVLKEAVLAQADPALKTTAIRCALKLAGAQAGGESRACYIDLLKIAPDDRARMTTADALFNVEGIDLFTTLQSMFNDATHGAAAKKLYVAYFDQHIKDQAGKAAGKEIDPKNWKAKASHADGDTRKAFDRDPGSRWSSNTGSTKGMWFILDLGESTFVSEVTLDTENSAGDTPNGVEAYTSDDNKTWGDPVAKIDKGDNGGRGKTVIPMAAKGRYIKFVTLGERPGLHWSIHEIYLKAGLDEKKVEAIRTVADTLR